jgi:hypothetical protein
MRIQNLCPMIVVLMLTGCPASLKPPPLQTRPLLDSALAQDCKPINVPNTMNIDEILTWIKFELFRDYGECAIRHKKTVEAWPK